MCLEDKELKDKEADCCRKEATKNFSIVANLLAEISKLTENVHLLPERRKRPR